MTKKPSAKQIAARKKFAYTMKHGGFGKRKSGKVPLKKRGYMKETKQTSIDAYEIVDALRRAFKDYTVKQIIIKR